NTSTEVMRHIAGGVRRAGSWLLPAAQASSNSPAEALRGLVPRLATLDAYLDLVASLLEQQTSAWLAENDRVPERMIERLDPLVRATAWKESCWRQLAGSVSDPQVLRSPVGAVGMMQINGRVWRSVYDLDRLSDEVDYNVNAGIEILTHYMVDYAIRRGEHEQPGGDDNLIKATYAAYNGGPSQLGRYRREDTPARLQAIDNEFWRHYTAIKADRWPDISSCYAVGSQ
ncbi:MAG: lytic transglycosylase domain-containing protein, partial [Pseudomonadota bacterium]